MTKEEIVKGLVRLRPLSFMSLRKGSQSELTINGWSMQGDAEDLEEAAQFLAEVNHLIVCARKSLTTEDT